MVHVILCHSKTCLIEKAIHVQFHNANEYSHQVTVVNTNSYDRIKRCNSSLIICSFGATPFCLIIIRAWRLINYKEALAENYPLINVMIQLWLLLVHHFMIQIL